ncbi:DUF433 domain-containing protein [Microbacterium sp. CFBP 13617]|uniref:DUF433 domain-containing protein n=1 Tax=Microbacterium sp. CFBP 13617 TaxID=2774035 RepID=UPI00177E73E9|nr:DUF433 domain-containing protein [Microbacterium sp. CFBP 13617]MBD8218108.1 DUF433 domain-containing protein [Microbacterium sp. CFBP 13617]
MSGASVAQLAYWRKHDILMPEIEHERSPYLYSFRDIVALRTFAWLRIDHSLQAIRRSLDTLRELDMVEHPATYKLVKNGKGGIAVLPDDEHAIELAAQPGQTTVGSLNDVFEEFTTARNKRVEPLLHPRRGVEVNPSRLGGWPTITGTRIPFDLVAELVGDGSVPPERVDDFYPGVTADDARDALDYHRSIKGAAE